MKSLAVYVGAVFCLVAGLMLISAANMVGVVLLVVAVAVMLSSAFSAFASPSRVLFGSKRESR